MKSMEKTGLSNVRAAWLCAAIAVALSISAGLFGGAPEAYAQSEEKAASLPIAKVAIVEGDAWDDDVVAADAWEADAWEGDESSSPEADGSDEAWGEDDAWLDDDEGWDEDDPWFDDDED